MKKTKLLKNRATYTASTESIEVVAQNLRNIRIGYDHLGTGTTAVTLATLIAHSSAIKITVGGNIETLIRHDDLFALNYILHDIMPDLIPQKPFYLLTTTVDNTVGFIKTILPIGLTTDKKVYINMDYAAVTNADTSVITLEAEHGDKPFPSKPLALRYISGNVTTSFVEYDISVAGKRLIGLLLFSTTIPASTTFDATLDEVKLLVDREEKCHFKWACLDAQEYSVPR